MNGRHDPQAFAGQDDDRERQEAMEGLVIFGAGCDLRRGIERGDPEAIATVRQLAAMLDGGSGALPCWPDEAPRRTPPLPADGSPPF